MKPSLLRAELPLHFVHIRFDACSSVGSDITAIARRDSPFRAQTHVFRIAKKSRGSARGWMRPQPSQDSTAFGRSASHDQQVAKLRARCQSAREMYFMMCGIFEQVEDLHGVEKERRGLRRASRRACLEQDPQNLFRALQLDVRRDGRAGVGQFGYSLPRVASEPVPAPSHSQLIKDFEDVGAVNQQLEKMGCDTETAGAYTTGAAPDGRLPAVTTSAFA